MIDVSGCVETLNFYFKTRLVSDRALLGFSRVRKLWMKTRNQRVLPGQIRSSTDHHTPQPWTVPASFGYPCMRGHCGLTRQFSISGITSLRSKAKAPLLSSWSVSKVSLAN